MITIKERTTGYTIPKIPGYTYFKLEKFFSVKNYYTKEAEPYMIYEKEKTFTIPKISRAHLEDLMYGVEFEIKNVGYLPNKPFKYKMEMKNQPKNDIQKEVISNVMKSFERNHRVAVTLPTGQGKTYVATNIISQLKTPTIVFVKTLKLKDQWLKSFYTHSTCRNIAFVEGSSDFESIDNNGNNYDIIITTHRTVANYIKTNGMVKFNMLLFKQGIGLKIFDEFDLETDSMMYIDSFTSIKHTLYLSATDYKSGSWEQKVFKEVFDHIPNFGKEYGIKPDRNAIFILYNSKPNKKQWGQCHRFSYDGPVFDYNKYHNYIVNSKSYARALKYVWNKLIKHRYNNQQDYLKTVFFIGRKTTAGEFKKDLSRLTGTPTRSISIVNSDVNKTDSEKNMRYKLIVTTSKSLGRGIDLNNLDTVIDLETRHSLSETTQVIGRVSRMGMKNIGTYVQFVDTAFPTVLRNFQLKLDKGFYDEQFTDIKIIELKDDEQKDKTVLDLLQ